uniref:CSON006775 protein n=1 Tax=Culicoides sonorensis TaxID=179676 RepID=A0A336MVW9_CULSO
MFALLLLILFLTVLWLIELKRRKLSALVKHLPGPKEIPIIGSEFVLKSEDITDFQALDSKECVASVMKVFLGPKLVLIVSDPVVLQQLLAQCQEKPYLINFFNLEFGLFSAKYPIWKPLRKGLSPAFSQRCSNSFIPIFDKHYSQLVKLLSGKLDTYQFDFHSYIQRQSFHLTLETTLNSTLADDYIDLHSFEEVEDIIGQRTMKSHLHLDLIYKQTNMFKREREIRASIEAMIDKILEEKSRKMAKKTTLNSTLADDYIDLHSFEEVEDIIGQRTMKSHLHLDLIYKQTNMFKREREIRASIEAMIDKILEEKSRKMSKSKMEDLQEQSNSHIFIDQLMHLNQDGRPLTPLEIRQNIIAIIFAGYETTAVTITYTILMLAMHPEVEKLVMNELNEVYKKGDVIDYDLLKQLEYLEMVIKETMRLFPSVPLTIRESIEDMNLDGVGCLPKGVTFVCSFYRLHRWESIWGADSNKFRPERFNSHETAARHPFSFMPFGSGSRNCLGNRYAMLSIKTGLIHLLTNYKFTTNLKMDDIKLKFSITLKLLNTNILKVEKR